jgi:hypothetical protein
MYLSFAWKSSCIFLLFKFGQKHFHLRIFEWVNAILHFHCVNNIWSSFCQPSQFFWHAFICILSTLRYLWYSNPWYSHAIFQINLMMPWLSLLQCLTFEYDVMWSNHTKERKLGLVTRSLFRKYIIVIF